MDKSKKYYGIILLVVVVFLIGYVGYNQITPKINESKSLDVTVSEKTEILEKRKGELTIVLNKIEKINKSIADAQKKIYSPEESDLGNDSLFFALYEDMLGMLKQNSIKIKKIKYAYNPNNDNFVKYGKSAYFVCDIDMDLVSNYVNLGKFIQEIYQYPYYIKINNLEIVPYKKDKKILLTKLSLRLYARTEPDETVETATN